MIDNDWRPVYREARTEVCEKCDAEIDLTRRVDFTLKDGTRVCDSCFVKETPRHAGSRPQGFDHFLLAFFAFWSNAAAA